MLGGGVLAEWQAGLDDMFALIAGRFARVEPRRLAFAYIRGLLTPLERRNGWTIAEHAGRRSPNAVQEMLYSRCWDPRLVRDDVRDYLIEHLGDPAGVLIGDDTGFVKKGVASAGVQRQYSGTAGKVENCQIGTFLAYASPKGRALIDRELYLPKSWIGDRGRCQKAAVPDDVEFATKPQQARAMIERAVAAGVPFAWFTADEAFGQNPRLRDWLQEQDIAYVMATRSDDEVPAGLHTFSPVKDMISRVRAGAWQRMSCGDGAHGPRVYDWAWTPIRSVVASGRRGWVLARRSISTGEVAYYRCFGRRGTRLRDLVPGRRRPLGDRGVVPDRQERGRSRPIPGPPL
jgi:SRSO17 transposase